MELWKYLEDTEDNDNTADRPSGGDIAAALAELTALNALLPATALELPDPTARELGATAPIVSLAFSESTATHQAAELRALLGEADKLSVRSARVLQVLLESAVAENEWWTGVSDEITAAELQVRRQERDRKEQLRYMSVSEVD